MQLKNIMIPPKGFKNNHFKELQIKMTFVIPYNNELILASNEEFEFKPWKELEQEQNGFAVEKLLKDNQQHLKEITTSNRELRYLKETMSLMQNEINRLHQVKEPNGVLRKLKKLVGLN